MKLARRISGQRYPIGLSSGLLGMRTQGPHRVLDSVCWAEGGRPFTKKYSFERQGSMKLWVASDTLDVLRPRQVKEGLLASGHFFRQLWWAATESSDKTSCENTHLISKVRGVQILYLFYRMLALLLRVGHAQVLGKVTFESWLFHLLAGGPWQNIQAI